MHAAAAPKERRAKRQLPTRDEQIKSLQTESFDVLIIGGGASGSGCALDAVTRGTIHSARERNIRLCRLSPLFALLPSPTHQYHQHTNPSNFCLVPTSFLYKSVKFSCSQ